MYEDWTDEELVTEIISQRGDSRSAHLDALFWRYFDRFEKNIRAVLRSQGIAYTEDETHYNEVFDGIYESLFGPRTFRKTAAKYDPARSPVFRTWFLGTVKRNRIRDWLRTMNPDRGVINRKWLAHRYPLEPFSEQDHLSQSEGPGRAEPASPSGSASGLSPMQTTIQNGLDTLPVDQRILTKLLFWGVAPLTDEERDRLVDIKGGDPRKVREELAAHESVFEAQYARDLEKAQDTDSRLGMQHYLLLKNEEAISLKRLELRSLKGEEVDLEKLEAESQEKGLVEVANERKAATRQLQKGKLAKDAYRQQVAELELVEMLVRRRKLQRKMETLTAQMARLFTPVNRAVRDLMGLDSGGFTRLRKSTLQALRGNLNAEADRDAV